MSKENKTSDKQQNGNDFTDNVRRSFHHTKVNLRDEDIRNMISTYEFLVWDNKGEDKKHCQRVLRQLKKSVSYA